MKLHVLFLTALPMCLGQFSIQGPSDGNRRAQGLKFSEEKGIEYTDQSESEGAGDFTIQGATDGNSNFRIQGATDGHSNFQIQGPSDGGAATFNIQGPTDGHSQSIIQGAYDPNQGNAKALEYNDPSGYRVNWRSYERQPRPATYAEPQYAAQAAAPVRQAGHRRAPPPQPQQQQAPEPAPQYKHYANAPPQIQQLLQFQQQIPYLNVIPEQYRFDEQAAIQAQTEQVREHFRNLKVQPPPGSAPPPPPPAAPAPEPRHRARGPSRHKREASPQQQQQQHRRISQPPAEPQPHYSTNLPRELQELLKFQAQTPYNIFANQVSYRGPDKPYVPQSVNPPQQQLVQKAQYQGQGGAYQAQASAYTQARVAGYNQGPQLGYNQQQQQQPAGVRPVTENQYLVVADDVVEPRRLGPYRSASRRGRQFCPAALRISSFSIMRFLFLILVVAPVLGTELHSHIRVRRQHGNVRSLSQAPAAIKQILASQLARDPIVHLPPQPVPNLSLSKPIEPQYVTQAQLSQYRPQVQIGQPPEQPTYKQIPVRPAQYSPPASAQQPQYNPQPQQQQPQYNPQYRSNYQQPQSQQAAQPNYQYSKNLPPQLQQLVQIQQNLPNAIPAGQHQG
ncbi:mediator of RNA polymerase II transcription subunit 15 [Harpegnathos saltator]|uniref:mediator of RNA polymerase II transcription subunit 15 n=1 Tax=Harpegnathos saltator TaxID=610380 RepID=UPI000DBEDF92|nr:mediator of RNA polymerase II transcription subunit 15 [Harpegnathos saltator]